MASVLPFVFPARDARDVPLGAQLPTGRLIELVSTTSGAQMTTAVACLRHAQAQGETAAWIQYVGGSLFPPDLAESGIDLEALLVVNVPATAGAHAPIKAAELLLRSGGFGMVVLDLSEAGAPQDLAWQGRLLGLARAHRVARAARQPLPRAASQPHGTRALRDRAACAQGQVGALVRARTGRAAGSVGTFVRYGRLGGRETLAL